MEERVRKWGQQAEIIKELRDANLIDEATAAKMRRVMVDDLLESVK